ncbi:hypothetical protein H112_01870 [Trichophyton rubrum D6]|uniref:Transmembrane protein n=3 Tax=Trichophyton TaxID=5550 RepID=A0A080WL59_TRIRC|nr:uncharacterized protein TERG_12433 [Trichophyton rubrum CBS 118892]EZF25855.1 hypothetical protein H100_01866 [Trichophyton rubrum MR850]EZF44832.1 hypothetical protein H102_01864 [Trichophyton rubrum CBS 100081]EZF55484.1 hypothetical protein H103_01875 [Trichophyton rubrum CBS 288.86]EZF66064.1 hypothetical protein H104_01849 [Trichophyton rubrum CBS 289.86]EZF76834.1 hypothetical protein H105_01880 [Trichophyton soudanense CBS 452.61]EZF87518.1 hypothetical protein H110_01873 [Trichophy
MELETCPVGGFIFSLHLHQQQSSSSLRLFFSCPVFLFLRLFCLFFPRSFLSLFTVSFVLGLRLSVCVCVCFVCPLVYLQGFRIYPISVGFTQRYLSNSERFPCPGSSSG